MKNCPICGGSVEYTTKTVTHTYKNHSRDIEQPGDYCTSCNEGFLTSKDLKVTREEIVNFHREIDHFLTTKEMKKIRKKIHLNQQEASALFGGGVRAFYKYETAEITQSKPLDILFRLLDQKKISLDDIKNVAI